MSDSQHRPTFRQGQYFSDDGQRIAVEFPAHDQQREIPRELKLAEILQRHGLDAVRARTAAEAILDECEDFADQRARTMTGLLLADFAERLKGTAPGEALRRVIIGDGEGTRELKLAEILQRHGLDAVRARTAAEAILDECEDFADQRARTMTGLLLADFAERLKGTAPGEALRRVIIGDGEGTRQAAKRCGGSHVAIHRQQGRILKKLAPVLTPPLFVK